MGISVTKAAAVNILLLVLSPPCGKSPYALVGLLRIRLARFSLVLCVKSVHCLWVYRPAVGLQKLVCRKCI